MIVGGTTASIKSLKKEVRTLERLKRQKDSSNSWNSSINITVSSTDVSIFRIQAMARQGLVKRILRIFQKNKSEILDANGVRKY
jgi:glycine cleavage system regulatory protein